MIKTLSTNRKKYEKIIYFALFLVVMIACNKDDDSDNRMTDRIEMVCSSIEEIDEVTVTNVSITAIDDGDSYGYILLATITNNSNELIEGEPIFQFSFSNNVPLTVSGPGICGTLPENSVCDYDNYIFIGDGDPLDFNPTIECFGYIVD
tara:strand:+ start:316 stop:762 length:447 start_codon:yes stop_codon:yes gene_type:complete